LNDPGPPLHDRGGGSRATFGLGAALDIERAILFGGLKVAKDAGVMQVNVGFEF
jgi:hypothetical protein